MAWLDPLEELDELGVLEGDWSWLLFEAELELVFEPLELLFELEDELAV